MNRQEYQVLEKAQSALNRAEIYRVASAVFAAEPSDEELDALIALASGNAPGEGLRASEAALFGRLATLADEDPAARGTRVRSEYAELFVGPRPPLAPYYESIYIGFPNRLFTEVTKQVKRYYERYGLAVERMNKVPDDHMAYELEFMKVLCERQAASIEAGEREQTDELARAQSAFLMMHLGQWTGPFAERIEASEASVYYAAWARFVHELVQEDLLYLAAEYGDADQAPLEGVA